MLLSLAPSPKTVQAVEDHFTVIELHQPISVTKGQSGCWGPFYCYWVTSTCLCHQRPIRMLGTILLLLSYINLSLSPKTNQDVGDHFTVTELHQPISVTKDQSGCWGPFYCYWVTSTYLCHRRPIRMLGTILLLLSYINLSLSPKTNQDVGDHFTVAELHQCLIRMLGTILLLLSNISLAPTPKAIQDVGDHFIVIELHQRPIRMLGTILLLLNYISLAPTPKTDQDIGDMDWQTKHFITSGLRQSRKIWSVEELETLSAGSKPKMACQRSQQHQRWNCLVRSAYD